jgi:hypothetical protein
MIWLSNWVVGLLVNIATQKQIHGHIHIFPQMHNWFTKLSPKNIWSWPKIHESWLAGFFYKATLRVPMTLGVEIQHARKSSSFSPGEVLKQVKYWLVTNKTIYNFRQWLAKDGFEVFTSQNRGLGHETCAYTQ